jgi:DNA-binding winged helix-turn-helix (wHTH) protein
LIYFFAIVEESTLSRAVALLRKQLGDDPKNPVFVETVPTLGYRFIAPVGVGAPATLLAVVATLMVIRPSRNDRRFSPASR